MKRYSIQLDVINRCLSNCKSCERKTWPQQEEMSEELIRTILNDNIFLDVESVFISGGEPLIYKHIDFLLDELGRRNILVGLLTAGNIDVDWEKYVANKKIKWLRFSIDAGSEEVYKEVRGVPHFSKVIDNLETCFKLAKKYGRQDNFLRINFTKSSLNKEEVQKLEEVLLSREISVALKTWDVAFKDELKIEKDTPVKNKLCNVVANHFIIDCSGKVYPCCYLMQELVSFQIKGRDLWCYGQIIPGSAKNTLSRIFLCDRSYFIKKHLYDFREIQCKDCHRYELENLIHEKRIDDGGYFL